jgi:RNase P subunit RPR2
MNSEQGLECIRLVELALSSEDIEKAERLLNKAERLVAADARLTTCAVCKEPLVKLLKCSKCLASFYCGPACQRADWSEHKKVCGTGNESSYTRLVEACKNMKIEIEKQKLQKARGNVICFINLVLFDLVIFIIYLLNLNNFN